MGLGRQYGVGDVTRGGYLFSSIVASSATAIAPSPGALVRVDLATAAADVVITIPGGVFLGQVIGVILTSDDGVHNVTISGGPSDAYPMWTTGDWWLVTWDGTVWVTSSYKVAPGYLTDLGAGSLVAAYRFRSRTNFVTDYSGNGRNLTALGTLLNGPGYAPGLSSVKTLAGVGTSTSAGFRLVGAMSLMMHVFNFVGGPSNAVFMSCGLSGAASATNLLWSLTTSGGGGFQYFAESGVGVDITYLFNNSIVVPIGWCVIGLTRSAGQVVKLYLNGALCETSGVLTAPDNGGSSNLGVGSYSSGANPVQNTYFAQSAVWGVELSAAQMLRGARQLMGMAA